MSFLQKQMQSKGLPPTPSLSTSSGLVKRKKDYSLKPWTDYFEESKKVTVEKNTFQIYKSGTSGPLIIFLHGGGFSGLSWALLTKALTALVECQCVAVDLRGHGETSTEDDMDLSSGTLAGDVCNIVDVLCDGSPVVLIGHSMGGAIAVHAALQNQLRTLAALIVIDVVEGTALDSLHTMHYVLQNRPTHFDTIERANEWCVRSGYIRNLESARVSMIGQLSRKTCSGIEVSNNEQSKMTNPSSLDSIGEEEEVSSTIPSDVSDPKYNYVWRIDLSNTSKYWEGWFRGLSSLFLSVPVPKILMLAGVDRLDKELSIGQMQGKFQLQVMSKSGHAVHEDIPDKVAGVISTFLVRHKLSKFKR